MGTDSIRRHGGYARGAPIPPHQMDLPLEIKLAVERILNRRNANFELMSKEECAHRISEVMKAQEEEKHLRMHPSS